MNQTRKNQTFELEKLIRTLENKESKSIAIVGKINNKKTKIINSLHQYMSTNESTNTRIHTTFYNSLIDATKRKKVKKFEYEQNIEVEIINKGVYSFNAEVIQETIGMCLRENLKVENMHPSKLFKRISNRFKKWKLNRIRKKLDYLEKHWIKSISNNKMKTIFPILTTITTIGTSIGTPILSVALLRNKEIIETFSYAGYIVLLAFCGLAIISGIVSVIFYLVSSIISSRYELISKNLLDGYKKILAKYFILPTQTKENTKQYRKKLKITKNQNYYLNEIIYNEKDYWTNLDLLMIHNALGNNVCFTVTILENYQIKNIFSDSWGSSLNYSVFDVNNYKNGYNKEKIIKFMLSRISKDFGFDFISLYRKNEQFKNYIDVFYETSDNNLQVLNLLNIFKTHILKKVDKKYFEKNIDFFVDVLYMYLIKSLDFYTFDLLIDSLVNELRIPKDIDSKYNLFKIENFFTKNLLKFKDKALLSNINNVNNEIFFTEHNILSLKNNEVKKVLKEFLENNEFKNKKRNIENNKAYVNNSGDLLLVFEVEINDESENVFEKIEQLKTIGLKHKASYIVIDFGFNFMILQNNLNNYQTIAWSWNDAQSKKLM